MTEEEKKKKFGDKYNPNFKPKPESDNIAGKAKRVSYRKEIPWKNDWRYYALDEQIAKDTASIPYNKIPGVYSDINWANGNDKTVAKYEWDSAHFASIDVMNFQSPSNNTEEGINYAMNQLYTFIRHVNSGAKNYEPADVGMYVLALRDIYSSIFEIQRAIGITEFFSVENRAVPKKLVQALGINYDDLIGNVAQYRARLNKLVKLVNALAMPKYFNAFKRSAYIYSNVFADSDSIRGQFYVFKRVFAFQYNSTSGSLNVVSWTPKGQSSTLRTVGSLLDVLQAQINAINYDSDMNTISGDILHAFNKSGDAELYQIATITEDYIVVPKFDEDILAQIENSFSLSAYAPAAFEQQMFDALGGYELTQTGGIINSSLSVVIQPGTGQTVAGKLQYPTTKLFNSHKDKPEFYDNLEWSRLIVIAKCEQTNSNEATVTLESCGLELVIGIAFHENDASYLPQVILGTASYSTAQIQNIMRVEEFDWHPVIYSMGTLSAPGIAIGADVKKYTLVEDATFKSMNENANAAAFYAETLYKKGGIGQAE